LQKEEASQRIYLALAGRESNETRQKALIGLAETEKRHGEHWVARLKELGAELPFGQESLRERIWRWVLVQSGTDNTLKCIESAEDDDTEMYEALAQLAPTTSTISSA
jgi:rubrerythrin